ncbi:histidine phosphatase family protein, partial [Streptomyces sp. SID6041]|nr:histidine phosphatase family protein [Streptomyces sp. SID6041]
MTVRLTLISPATSGAPRDVAFGDDRPLDPGGAARAASVASSAVDPSARAYSSPSACCRGTAEALGLSAEAVPA